MLLCDCLVTSISAVTTITISHLSPSSDLLSPLTTITPTPTPPSRPRSSSKHQWDEDTFTPPSMPVRSSRHAHSASVPMTSSQVASSFDATPSTASATPFRRNSLKTGRHTATSAIPPPCAQRPNHGHIDRSLRPSPLCFFFFCGVRVAALTVHLAARPAVYE